VQPFKVEMTQDSYTTLQNIRQHELYGNWWTCNLPLL